MVWPSDLVSQLINDALKRPLSKTLVSILVSTISHCKQLSTEQLQTFTDHVVVELEALPEKKYSYLGKVMELLMELEHADINFSRELEDRIIAAVRPSGYIPLLTFLARRNSSRIVYPPVESLTP